jgi:hypothetical protein
MKDYPAEANVESCKQQGESCNKTSGELHQTSGEPHAETMPPSLDDPEAATRIHRKR